MYSNRIHLSTHIRQCTQIHSRQTRPTHCATILVNCSVRDSGHNFATSSDLKVSGFTVHMLRIRCEFIFFHSGEQIKKYPDWLLNSPDACGRKPYSERKSCGFKNIQIRVDEGLRRHGKLDSREKNTPVIK